MRLIWPEVCISDVVSLNRSGFWGEPSPIGSASIAVNVVRNGDISREGELRGAAERFFTPGEASAACLAQGDVAITMSGEPGKAWLVDRAGFHASNFIRVLRPDPSRIKSAFLRYALETEQVKKALRSNTTGSTIQNLQRRFYEEARFPLPTLSEQDRILNILDEAFECIARAKVNAERNTFNARELYDSQLETLISSRKRNWPESPLEQVASIINGYAFKSTDFQATPGVRSIKITNVGVRTFVENDDNYLPADFAKRYAEYLIPKGSIVLALTRTIIAGGLKVAVVPDDFDGALLNQRVAAIRPRVDKLEPPFLFAYLSTRKVMDYVKSRVNTLMQPNMSIVDLRQLPVPIPTIHEQREVQRMLNQFDDGSQALATAYHRQLTALNELGSSLLRLAFAGQLVDRSVEPEVAEFA